MNNNEPKFPCENCITFAICKATVHNLITKENQYERLTFFNIWYNHILKEISKKCRLIIEYVDKLEKSSRFKNSKFYAAHQFYELFYKPYIKKDNENES